MCHVEFLGFNGQAVIAELWNVFVEVSVLYFTIGSCIFVDTII